MGISKVYAKTTCHPHCSQLSNMPLSVFCRSCLCNVRHSRLQVRCQPLKKPRRCVLRAVRRALQESCRPRGKALACGVDNRNSDEVQGTGSCRAGRLRSGHQRHRCRHAGVRARRGGAAGCGRACGTAGGGFSGGRRCCLHDMQSRRQASLPYTVVTECKTADETCCL